MGRQRCLGRWRVGGPLCRLLGSKEVSQIFGTEIQARRGKRGGSGEGRSEFTGHKTKSLETKESTS